MTQTSLSNDDIKNITLRYKINGLSMIANLIPTRAHLIKINPLNGRIAKKPDINEIEKFNISLYLNYDEKINEILKEFIETLNRYSNEININNLYKNLKTLKVSEEEIDIIKKVESKIGLPVAMGSYNPLLNRIKLLNLQKIKKETITHELIHFSSSIIQKGVMYSGFKQSELYKLTVRGRAINEGTTEFINYYLFDYSIENCCYQDLVYITKGIANLIGREKLMELYFNNDLEGLIKEIGEYSDKKTAVTIVKGMDKLHSLRYKSLLNVDLPTSKELEENLISLVANLNLKKQKQLLANNEITLEEYENNKLLNVDIYETKNMIQKIDSKNNESTYIIESIDKYSMFNELIINESEYKMIISTMKEEISDITTDKKQKQECINSIIKKIKKEREEKKLINDMCATTDECSVVSDNDEIKIYDINGKVYIISNNGLEQIKEFIINDSQFDNKTEDTNSSGNSKF